MNLIDFQKLVNPYLIFSLQDITKIVPNFSYRQLDRWEKKGYIRKIKQGFYALANLEINEFFLLLTANKIYSPSYISLKKALKFYGLIPEEIFQITSVGTKKTTNFQTPIGNFSYRQINPRLFWGYRLMEFGSHRIMFAEAEKAILDYLYLNAHLKTKNDFLGMRIDFDSFQEHVDLEKFHLYLEAFKNKSLTKRTCIFLDTIKND